MSIELTAGQKRRARKARYKTKFEQILRDYKNALVIGVDNVGSLQMAKIRVALRGKGIMVLGKNTLMRKIIRDEAVANPKLESLLEFVRGNMGLVFTNGDLQSVRTIITSFKVPAAAKAGTLAQCDVFVPAGPTGLDPGQTGFFQALNIATKIVRGSIEIVNVVHLIKQGDKVTSSAVALLAKIDIKPFFYGCQVSTVFEDGSVYPVNVLDMTQDDLLKKFLSSVGKLTAVSLAVNWPSQLTLPIYVASAFRKLLAISAATEYKFEAAEKFLSAAAAAPKAAAPAAAPAAAGKDDKKGGKKEEKKKEEEPEEDDFVGAGGLFD
jgi:large subunit ribosomal protein LP0